MVLNASANNGGAVEFGGALSGDCGALWIAAAHNFGDAACGVVCDDAFELWMCVEEAAALRECCRMRLHGFDRFEACAGTTDQVLFDPDFNSVDDVERFCIEKIY